MLVPLCAYSSLIRLSLTVPFSPAPFRVLASRLFLETIVAMIDTILRVFYSSICLRNEQGIGDIEWFTWR